MTKKITNVDVLVIGASASGLMCAIEAGKRGRSVSVLDHENKAGKKILMSGGGRCNFTNMDIDANNYISHNSHFCKSALSRYTQWDFISMVNKHDIPYHERDLGKLFCNESAKDILQMLLTECKKVSAKIQLNHKINSVKQDKQGLFFIETTHGTYSAASLVIACGGLSIPKMCASPLGYKIAEQFGHNIWPTSAGLVPFTLQPHDKEKFETLSGISVESNVSNEKIEFNNENILFTHRGLSGPAILQLSSYWKAGETININLLPKTDIVSYLQKYKKTQPNIKLKNSLSDLIPKRLVTILFEQKILDKTLQETSNTIFSEIAKQIHEFKIKPNGTEGYRTAEVTLGGINCNELSSKTMESKINKGLYFIGEVVDVTGWLGGYNFQWAWSSGWCAGQVV